MAKLTEEQRKARALARAKREALAAEEEDRREREKRAQWRRDGTYMTREELEAGVPCRGCGEPIIDGLGSFPGTMYLTPEQKVEYEKEEARYRQRHGDCKAHRWTMGGSRTHHCGFCCPPPPLSQRQIEAISKILVPAVARRTTKDDLDDWDLTLTCDHVVRVQAHRSNRHYSARVLDCPECNDRRGVVTQQRIGPSGDRAGQVERERLTAEIKSAEEKLRRQRRAMEKTEEAIRALSDQLGGIQK
ncbi:hypothetical protein [Actinomadura sp. HBU206391]|uniref:hypothetical protein n=1 Tax=Actinomadura sp. HBU206391 TaxID=2731692 RepID=UPI00164EDA6A|nr:hypothetical protein [Actinomadura sp. HBU206391]MBC6463343.1 hypothetical protein [Actinomadura sp. HBU206391]